MKKLTILIFLCFSATVLLSACISTKPQNVVKYERKYEKLIKQQGQLEQKEPSYGIIDLSDGNKVNYDANFGPSFDIK